MFYCPVGFGKESASTRAGAGADGRYFAGEATVRDGEVVVTSPHVPAPVAVRFGWDEAAQPNLINGAGLPAVPFRSTRKSLPQ